tara:strand:- start:4936 stop:6249 length:1314 start_codon:yes stop_codon:yes gene_type:complete
MKNMLPKNWVETTIGDLFTLRQGIQVSKPDQSLEFKKGMVQFLRIVDFTKTNELARYVTDPGETYHMQKDDIALVRYGTVGFVCYGKTGVIANNLFRVIPNIDINKKYVTYYLKSSGFQHSLVSKGATMQALSFKTVNPILFPLPPLAEQQRIVAKLDELFLHLDSLKNRLNNIPKILKNFRQAVLTQAVTGKLTEEWRVGKELEEWQNHKLNDLCLSITDGDHQAPPRAATGVPFLVISNVSKGYFDFESVTRYVPKDYFESLKYTRVPKLGDVLYTVTGSYGISLLVNFDKEFCFQRHIAILKPDNSKLDSLYLNYGLSSSLLMNQAHNVATGTAQKTVPLRGIKSFELPLPPKKEQTEIVKRIKHLFTKAAAIEAQYQSLKAKIDSLPQAILAKAFKGELVEQLYTDGDAKELLKEIEKLKSELSGKKKVAKKK